MLCQFKLHLVNLISTREKFLYQDILPHTTKISKGVETMIKPLHDRVLLKIKEEEEKTSGGIYLPASARDDDIQEAEVISVGELKILKLKSGDKVLVEKHAGTELKIDGKKHLLVKEDRIIAQVN
ncbi:MAG: chaperonin GroES [archaeon GW2011_AR4]|nr:MAG: chaperonin GroES [archaeon GW2011_AR4]